MCVMPAATMASISMCGAYGVLPSVPRTILTPAGYHGRDQNLTMLKGGASANCHTWSPPRLHPPRTREEKSPAGLTSIHKKVLSGAQRPYAEIPICYSTSRGIKELSDWERFRAD